MSDTQPISTASAAPLSPVLPNLDPKSSGTSAQSSTLKLPALSLSAPGAVSIDGPGYGKLAIPSQRVPGEFRLDPNILSKNPAADQAPFQNTATSSNTGTYIAGAMIIAGLVTSTVGFVGAMANTEKENPPKWPLYVGLGGGGTALVGVFTLVLSLPTPLPWS